MIKIAIADGDVYSTRIISDMLFERNDIAEIQHFYSYKSLIDEIENGFFFHVLIIEMNWDQREIGFDIAEILLERNVACRVIFISKCADPYVQRLHFYDNFSGFLLKPLDAVLFNKTLNLITAKLKSESGQIMEIYTKTGHYMLNIEELVFLEGKDHNVEMHLTNEKLPIIVSKSLCYYEQELPEYFARCHKGFIVNLHFVKSFSRLGIQLRTGESIAIGRTYLKQFRDIYVRSMSGG